MELIIGNTSIKYEIKPSDRAEKKRIIVTPGKVVVVAPSNQTKEDVIKFVHSKRKWVYIQLERMGNLSPSLFPANFITGAKVPYKGRMLKLTVRYGTKTRVKYKAGITITLPKSLNAAPSKRNKAARKALIEWLTLRMTSDCKDLIDNYGRKIKAFPKSFRIKEQKHLWGSCGKDNILNFNWQLILAPKAVLEYAVLHELCHLRFRNHSNEFWGLIRSVMPDYEYRKKWFERNERKLKLS